MASWRRGRETTNTHRSGWILAALVLTLGLGGLRASDLLAEPPAPMAGLTAHEARLTGLVETVAGPGHARVHETRTPDGLRQFFILIDTASSADGLAETELGELLEAAGLFNPLRGDLLTVRRAAFANGPFTQATPAEAAELIAYLLLAACLLGQIVSMIRAPVTAPAAEPRRQAEPARPIIRDKPATEDPAAHRLAAVREAMSEDPAEAARIIRAWVRNELERP